MTTEEKQNGSFTIRRWEQTMLTTTSYNSCSQKSCNWMTSKSKHKKYRIIFPLSLENLSRSTARQSPCKCVKRFNSSCSVIVSEGKLAAVSCTKRQTTRGWVVMVCFPNRKPDFRRFKKWRLKLCAHSLTVATSDPTKTQVWFKTPRLRKSKSWRMQGWGLNKSNRQCRIAIKCLISQYKIRPIAISKRHCRLNWFESKFNKRWKNPWQLKLKLR